MKRPADPLPNDVASLKALLLAERSTTERLQKQVQTLFEAIRLARQQRFGASSEKAPGQGELFDEVEETLERSDQTPPDTDGSTPSDTPVQATTTRKARRPLPAHLPRIHKLIELPEAERVCACGCQLSEIGEDSSEQLEIIPAKLQVIRYVRKKYACQACEDTVKVAPRANVLLPKAIASGNTMAYVITAKYADGLPLYRLSTILQRHGIDLPRQTLSESVMAVAQKVAPLLDHLRHCLMQSPVIHMDETTVQVLKEPDKAPQSHSYMWVQRGGPPGQAVVLFHYAPGRSAAVPETLLVNYRGALMTDGYSAYRTVATKQALTHLCCWAHARRKFMDAKKAQPKGKSGRADSALSLISKLYAIEKQHKGSDTDTRQQARQTDSARILDDLKQWLDKHQSHVPPSRALGKAINYTLKYWPELTRYVGHGDWPIDNNAAENAIRPFVIGRKNWLFSNSQRGATASANLYSLIETAKANHREPYQYLSWLFERLPQARPEEYASLMPWAMPEVSDL